MTLFEGLQSDPPPVLGAAGQGAALHLRAIGHNGQDPPDPDLYSLLNRPIHGPVTDHRHCERDPVAALRFLDPHINDLSLDDLSLSRTQDGPGHHAGAVDQDHLVTGAATQRTCDVASLRRIEPHRSPALREARRYQQPRRALRLCHG